ncbi:ABC transporter permease [Tuwongella immobilis]|uniref:ABC3 transporter permease C-terminal domain-containing protein n=1 Tax=Tuwongella immobilis TaxID=692036 RepID=A0A6C2YWA8_9BACT|nr:ABC transporter permease [Tuwongella immobilis]VIP05443.1 abc transporter permease : ABC-type antimicrobial peptide transport system, permease component OS=Singulisphaera acidiphila (strain ATCC BAA-1392 / DSM 18658 / VKM B-2454 / MOB10) GN=Sinac_2084 PE=4 SV=1: FtsX [Tuwongella immobilis]VTS08242.1 abc transporter permease : ABC-type antimicrobial peptide transport system, permease component OS=Singulisphaera acidiphila (strain ATCC BAA-1392 / DSM 18658 / VKM B-2454 / MOB10) GN=Sinac_2084 PE=
MNYALQTLWHDRARFLPGVLAVAFSAVLIGVQCGLLLGLFSLTSISIDLSPAQIWVGSPKMLSVDLGDPIPESFTGRVASEPGIVRTEMYYQLFANFTKPDGGSDKCMIIGFSLEPNALGAMSVVTDQMRHDLSEPFAIVIDESDFDRLGIKQVGDTAEINKQRVRVVGTVQGVKGLAAAYILCSPATARALLKVNCPPGNTVFVLAECENPAEAPAIVERLREKYPNDMSVFASADFSKHSRLHWLIKTKAGIALGYAALLGLLVGLVVTSQTLYAATTASAREYAILLALGIPRWRVSMAVVSQSFWVGTMGILVAIPTIFGMGHLVGVIGIQVLMPPWLLASTIGVTMAMASLSGLMALRSVRQIEPNNLLR